MTRMRGLALFDLDNTLADRERAFRRWCEDFVGQHGLGRSAIATLVEADNDGHASRADFFGTVRHRFSLADSVETLMAEYRACCATIGSSVRAVLPGGREVVGTAVSVDEQGRLCIDIRPMVAEIGDEDDVVAVSAGDVVHLRPNL